jgi:outer membrane protein assembly factor BamE (lipoprotein component of BamABCDE complex)
MKTVKGFISMKVFFLWLLASLFFFNAGLVCAEDIKIPVGSQMPESQQIEKPTTGMTKAQVKSHFGEPQKDNPAKGKPPISSWEYAEFEVYFEADHVIHSVIKPKLHENKEIIIQTTDEISEDELKAINQKK